MKIAFAQLNHIVGDLEGNKVKIIDAIIRAKGEGADLVVFAEQAISGVPAYDLLRKSTFLELCEDALVEIASFCNGISAIVGLPMLTSRGTLSVAAVIEDRHVKHYISKRHISARREMGFISQGKGSEVVEISGHKFLISVGDDIRHLKNIDPSVQTILSINARKYGKGILTYRHEVLSKLAFVEGKNVMLINQVGGSSDIVYDGSSGGFNGKGEIILLMNSFEEDFAICDLDNQSEGMPDLPFRSYDARTRILCKAAIMGLKDYFEKNDYKKACIGISGGIDSALVTALAVAALGKENVMALIMPSEFSSGSSVEDARKLCENLEINYNVLPIHDVYRSIIATMQPVIGGTEFDNTEENIQSRIRTIMLMALQNKREYVVLNTSNKSERALGLFALYGDAAGAFSVIGDLYKGEVYDLARYINHRAGYDVIPAEILSKEPSSELRPNQKDTDILPPYEVVDAILFRMIEKGEHREEIINAGFDIDVVEKIHNMVMQSEKKRFQTPPVLRLSRYSFGHEWLLPLTNKYGD
ncbi:MAG: NAD+ synthase [Rikenellaceae bacterium]